MSTDQPEKAQMMPIRAEREVRELLAEVYTPKGIDMWLNGRHRWLDGVRPIDLIRAGEGARVISIARQISETSYA